MVRPRSEEKDRALVEAAIRLFLEKGVKGTTIQDIAKAANVAVGTVYVYYKEKGEIVRRVAFAFAERHGDFAAEILGSRRRPLSKLNAYILGFYDMWQPFGENTKGAMELAEGVFKYAPETPGIAQAEFNGTVEKILSEAQEAGMRVEKPAEEARWIALATAAFFPLAGTPAVRPMAERLTREDLEGLLKWIGRKLG